MTERLSASIAQLESIFQYPNIQLEIIFSKTLSKLDDSVRKNIVKSIIKQFRKYIFGLLLNLHGDEHFMKEAEFFCPNLKDLSVDSPVQGWGKYFVHSKESCLILEELFLTYGGTISFLEIHGYWDFNTSREYQITALQTLKIKNAMIMQVKSMFKVELIMNYFYLVDITKDIRI